jgi:hypothetical protein
MGSDDYNTGSVRTVFYTDQFREFYDDLDEKVRKKIDYVILIIKDFRVIHTDFVKKLVKTELYEMRVSVGTNEYRTILFAIDHENIMESTQVIILNGFLKKSSKDYDKQIKTAMNILNSLEQ